MGSIFEELRTLKEYKYDLGKKELEYIYISESMPVNEQLDLADYLIEEIKDIYDKNILYPKFHLEDILLIYYMNPLINKINILIMENVLNEVWVREFTENLIYKSETPWHVKLGLILSSRYLSEEKLPELFDVFSRSGEYIFYLMNTIRNLKGYNNYLVELSKKSKGTIKVFAITNIEYFSPKIVSYMIEEGYKDEIYEELLINYIFTTINLERYLENIDKKRLDNLSYLICSYLRKNEFSIIKSKYNLIGNYLSLVNSIGDNFENLNSIFLIREGIAQDETLECDIEELEKELNNLLEDEKWIDVFKKGIKDKEGLSEDVIALADFYDYQLEYKDLFLYLERDHKDFNIYCYLIEEGRREDKLKLLNYFTNHFCIDKICRGAQDIDDKELSKENIISIIFSLLIKSLKDIYPYGKEIALKALNGEINKIRAEAINYLSRYKDELNEQQLEEIKVAYNSEPNEEVKFKMKTLLFSCEEGKKEYIDINNKSINEHISDVYLLTTDVVGCQYRYRRSLEDELENSKIFYLQIEENNSYDNRAIKVAGESGFVIGYISRSDNYILSNLLKGKKYLYGKIEKYNLENNSIKTRIYLSYKDVIESINDTISMLHGSNTGGFLN
ncbi:HIRAN domain-containing protein [Clostridium sp. HBUAS56017]|uniref:HIRAN domain-containing protein n=1 Tax=Clostridium sp. HBUAS56017 TaxID=2571128 RepID=UPI0011781A1C|nr:HIRAN domain-containing protein [Clostridium sp. HBUAS56017]